MEQLTFNETNNGKLDKAHVELRRLVDLFSKQELPCLIKQVFFTPTDRPSHNWSLSNRLIMLCNNTKDGRTFNQWKDIGRYVKKGTKGFWIIAPNKVTRIVKETDKVTGKETQTPRTFMYGFKVCPYAMFRLEDTDGKPYESVKEQPKNLPPLSEVAQKLGASIIYDGTNHGEHGSFNPIDKEIRLCTSDESVFFHELAHLAHEKIDGKLKPGQNPEQEAIAQLSACVLASMYNMNIEGKSWEYIASYAKERSPDAVGKLCMQVLSKVEDILKLILSVQ